MNILKNLFLAASAMFALTTVGQAQELGKLRYRVEGGVAMSRLTSLGVHHNGDKGNFLFNLRAGGSVVLPFEETIFSFTPGLYVVGRGEGQGTILEPGTKKVRIQSYSLQLPLDMSFRLFSLNDTHRFFLNVGPYFAYGLSAKLTRGGDLLNPEKSSLGTSLDLYQNGYFKRFEFGVGANLMYQYQHVYLRGGIDASITGQVKQNAGRSLYEIAGTPRYVTSYITLGYEF